MDDKKQEIMDIKKKKYRGILLLVVLLLSVTVGFALLSTTFNISGESRINNSVWDVHFDNLLVNTGSITPDTAATITDDGLNITYAITLDKPGDFYEFTVDVVNEGTIDAKLKQLPTVEGVSQEQEAYVNYTFTHTDGSEILVGEELKVGESENFKVRVEFDSSITDDSQLPKTDQSMDLDVTMIYEQK